MAAPPPTEELDRLRQLLSKPLPRVVVVTGTSSWFREQAMDLLLAAVPPEAELRTVDGAPLDVRGAPEEGADEVETEEGAEPPGPCAELLDLAGAGLFARQNFLCVRRGERWLRLYGAALAAFLPRIAKGCCLLLETNKLDGRTKLSKQLQAAGPVFEFRDLYETPFSRNEPLQGELVRWIVAQAQDKGLQLTREAALLMVQHVGKAPGELVAELTRLQAQPHQGQRRQIGPEELAGRLSTRFESTQFELAEAVLGGDRRRALRSLRAMFDRGVRKKDGGAMDVGALFPVVSDWLYRSFASALEGRILRDEGVPDRELAARAGVFAFQERYVATVVKNPQPELRRGILQLLECQRALRHSGEEPLVLFEQFVDAWFAGRTALLPGVSAW